MDLVYNMKTYWGWDDMRFELEECEQLKILCAKSVSMAMATICTEEINTVAYTN